MADEPQASEGRGGGAALPLGLLALFLVLVGAAAFWASREPVPALPETVTIDLTAPPAGGATEAQPAPATPPAPEIPPAPPVPSALAPPLPPAAEPPPAPAPTPRAVEQRPAAPPPPAPAIKPPPLSPTGELAPAPDPALVQRTPDGMLPVIAPDGRRAWQVYARPFDRDDKRPRIAVLIAGLGASGAATEAAIQGLPGAVTLAFWPYADRIDNWIRLARAAGHEVILNLPMEPANYPDFDPGPKTLLTTLTPQQNLERLEWALSRFTGYVGVADFQGSRFTASRRDLKPILETLNQRGLIFVDSRTTAHSLAPEIAQSIGLPWVANARFIDDPQLSRDAIDARLREIESIARLQKKALAIGQPYPVTLERVAAWTSGLAEKGFALAPVTAVLEQKAPP